jgi:hypothetical protein
MDAMSDAVEGADVMLYAVSLRYKESANVSLSCHCSLSILLTSWPLLCLTLLALHTTVQIGS